MKSRLFLFVCLFAWFFPCRAFLWLACRCRNPFLSYFKCSILNVCSWCNKLWEFHPSFIWLRVHRGEAGERYKNERRACKVKRKLNWAAQKGTEKRGRRERMVSWPENRRSVPEDLHESNWEQNLAIKTLSSCSCLPVLLACPIAFSSPSSLLLTGPYWALGLHLQIPSPALKLGQCDSPLEMWKCHVSSLSEVDNSHLLGPQVRALWQKGSECAVQLVHSLLYFGLIKIGFA